MTNINSIKSILNVSRGPALKANYLVNVIPPLSAILDNPLTTVPKALLAGVAMKNLSMLAVEAALPGRRLSTTPHRMYGTVREMPYGVLYESIDITFMCTNIMIERAFFDIWQQYIIAPKTNYLNYYKDYIGTIIIQKIDNAGYEYGSTAGELISVFTLEDAYPLAIQPQPLAYDSKNEIMTLTVTFSYARWRSSLDYAIDALNILDNNSSGVTSPRTFNTSIL
jgi:hypothetical protein